MTLSDLCKRLRTLRIPFGNDKEAAALADALEGFDKRIKALEQRQEPKGGG